MSIETDSLGVLWIILIMAGVTLATRWGGLFLMSFIPIAARVRSLINAMSGSVLVAILAPMAVNGENGARLALLTTAIVMLLYKNPLISVTIGMIAAASFRAF